MTNANINVSCIPFAMLRLQKKKKTEKKFTEEMTEALVSGRLILISLNDYVFT